MGAGAPKTVRDFDDAIARAIETLRLLRAGRMEAKTRELEQRLVDVRRDYEDGVDRRVILRRHQITTGQLMGWAHRGGWNRPVELVKTLSRIQRSNYEQHRVEMPSKAAAVRAAREATQ